MTREEKALDYFNQFRECKFSSLQKPFTGADSGMGFILVYVSSYKRGIPKGTCRKNECFKGKNYKLDKKNGGKRTCKSKNIRGG